MTMKRMRDEELKRSQKLESIGILADGVANDFNNILTVIIGACSLLEMDAAEHPEQMTVVSRIRNYAERAAQLTQNLLAFSRSQTVVMKSENLTEVFHDMHRFLGSIIGDGITLVTEQPENALMVMIDRGQIEQVLMNLAASSRDAMPHGGVLKMTLSRLSNDGTLSYLDGYPVGDYALITVSDTGTGIDSESMSCIFDPYFTMKELDERSGLGLFVAYGIITQHRGVIHVQRTQGEGTTFRIYLPLSEQEEMVISSGDEAFLPGGSETILLVDSDPVMLESTTRLLERVGYMVLSASDGVEAMELLSRENSLISLVVIDSTSSDINRLELRNSEDVKVLVVCETADGATAHKGARNGVSRIAKPFEPLRFLEKVRALIDGASSDVNGT
jgi:nitrogen-specific signal transduction histidine kinase/CheY-like chemotaxis protein